MRDDRGVVAATTIIASIIVVSFWGVYWGAAVFLLGLIIVLVGESPPK